MMAVISHDLEASPKLPTKKTALPTMTDLLYKLIVDHGMEEGFAEIFPAPLPEVVDKYLSLVENCASPDEELDEDERDIIKVNRANYRNSKRSPGSSPPRLSKYQLRKRQKKANKRKNSRPWSYYDCQSWLYKAIDSFVTQAKKNDQKAFDLCSRAIVDKLSRYSDALRPIARTLGIPDNYGVEVDYGINDRFLHIYSSRTKYINWSKKGHAHYVIDIASGKQLYVRLIGGTHGSHNFTDETSRRLVKSRLPLLPNRPQSVSYCPQPSLMAAAA